MNTSQFENSELLKALLNDMDFSIFLEMKKNWLTHMRHEWLIMGHVTEEEAKAMVHMTESELKYNPIDPSQIPVHRLVHLQPHSVSEYQEKNFDALNPNSAV